MIWPYLQNTEHGPTPIISTPNLICSSKSRTFNRFIHAFASESGTIRSIRPCFTPCSSAPRRSHIPPSPSDRTHIPSRPTTSPTRRLGFLLWSCLRTLGRLTWIGACSLLNILSRRSLIDMTSSGPTSLLVLLVSSPLKYFPSLPRSEDSNYFSYGIGLISNWVKFCYTEASWASSLHSLENKHSPASETVELAENEHLYLQTENYEVFFSVMSVYRIRRANNTRRNSPSPNNIWITICPIHCLWSSWIYKTLDGYGEGGIGTDGGKGSGYDLEGCRGFQRCTATVTRQGSRRDVWVGLSIENPCE